jgi:hypothetical protein
LIDIFVNNILALKVEKCILHILISKRKMRIVEIKDMVDGSEYLIQRNGEDGLRGIGIFDSKITRDANYVSYDSHDSAGFRKFRKFPSELLNLGVCVFNSSNHVFFIPVFPRLTDESVLRQVINQGTNSALGTQIGSQ